MQEVTNNMYVLVLLGMLGISLLAGGLVYFVIRYQRNIMRERFKAQQAELDHQQQLLYATIQSQEAERTRIGRDLHDEICGALSNLQLQYAKLPVLSDGQRQHLHSQLKQVIDRARTLSHELSPPGLMLFGLTAAIEELADAAAAASQLNVTVIDEAPATLQRMGAEAQLAIYRIVQELLSNTLKHAHAMAVTITFRQQQHEWIVLYEDDGVGLDPAWQQHKGMGMHNVQSRAGMLGGHCRINENTTRGFSMILTIPI